MHKNCIKNKELFPNPPFFIIGIGRSGTTLLMAMLNAHPKVIMPPETHFLLRYIVPNSTATLEKAKSILCKDKYFDRLNIDTSKVLSLFHYFHMPFSWVNAYRFTLKEYLVASGKKYIGDKDPKVIEYLPVLHKLFPESKVLHMVRDPRDVFLSRQKAGWSKGRSWISHIMAYRIQFQIGRENGLHYFQSNYREIQYERLIIEPKNTLKEISKFLNIGFYPQMLAFSGSAKEIIAEDEKEWKKNVASQLISNNFDKWKEGLGRKQIIYIESLCDLVFRLGLYKKAYPKLILLERIKIFILRVAVQIAEYIYKQRLKAKNLSTKAKINEVQD